MKTKLTVSDIAAIVSYGIDEQREDKGTLINVVHILSALVCQGLLKGKVGVPCIDMENIVKDYPSRTELRKRILRYVKQAKTAQG